ncbi:DUF192 domain-containing protein [Halocatena pleomorpha]|uniref:DUF192 domain-containing protein n=1 Tax=Halocatena pleomorpha TaxID=1785090 RepID=A0A3P3RCG4_9EURY|nr:DUF192 domain-containing protein [Halocatena pleomorpha]RRJ31161.1 DUF192 domain-containing protein [Halocatena pleomorpha]
MRIVHESGRVLATDVELADRTSIFGQHPSVIGRHSMPEASALAVRFEDQQPRTVRMPFIFMSLDVCWICDGIVEAATTLRPLIGHGSAAADTVLEFPAGTLAENGVTTDDRIELRTPV